MLGETADGVKTTQRSPRILPELVIYDVDLTLSLPPRVSATSGMNAIAHAVEALYAQDANPVISLMAEEGIRALAGACRASSSTSGPRRPGRGPVWSLALRYLPGCGGHGAASQDLPRAGRRLRPTACRHAHRGVAPRGGLQRRRAHPRPSAAWRGRSGTAEAGRGLYDLEGRLGAPRSLREIGMPADGIEHAVALITKAPYWNPRPADPAALRGLLQRAFERRATDSRAERRMELHA